MRNLNVIRRNRVNFRSNIVYQCIDADNERLFGLGSQFEIFEVDNQNPIPNIQRKHHGLDLSLLNISRITSIDVILFEFIVESGSILIVLKSGHFIQLAVSSFSPPSACLYKHHKELSSVKLSPDLDLVAIADTNNDIFMLSIDCSEVLYRSNTLTENDSLHKPVGVGWGSKETQFFGLDGRPSKEKESKNKIVLSEQELATTEEIESSETFMKFRDSQQRNTVIDWRGDGQYLATLTLIPENGKHYLKVWNRNLELQYMSEQLFDIEQGLLSWIPNGQYICCAQRRERRINEIVMFERNGMVHQRLTLPTMLPDLYIKELAWSQDSKILAIIAIKFHKFDSNVRSKHILLLYTMQNFQYYLKYSFDLKSSTEPHMRWDPNSPYRLHINSSEGLSYKFDCSFEVNHCSDGSTAIVLDANKVLITPFDICNIPPPMYPIKIETNSLISRAVIHRSKLQLIILTVDNKFTWNTKRSLNQSEPSSQEQLLMVANHIKNNKLNGFIDRLGDWLSADLGPSHKEKVYQNLTLLDDDKLFATVQNDKKCDLVVIDLQKVHEGFLEPAVVSSIEGRQVVYAIKHSKVNWVQLLLDDASCVTIDLDQLDYPDIRHNFSIETSELSHIVNAQSQDHTNNMIITLTQDLTLRLNEQVIQSNCCTSFQLTEKFLIYTTSDNSMHILPVSKLAITDNHDSIQSWTQPIETGGLLVGVSEAESKVILQMPRGNLEIIHPRLLVLLSLENLLDEARYVDAIKLALRHRVDLNFLCDYLIMRHGELFYKNTLHSFINAIAKHDPSLLNLFITELSSESTVQGRYKDIIEIFHSKEEISANETMLSNDKINCICKSISLPHESRFLQPTLLSLFRQNPRRIKEALYLIQKLDSESRESSLRFLLYFINIDQLFSDSLFTYDTNLALMVASVSNKDPKEYLALLDKFNQIQEPNLRLYQIDLHIKSYEDAFMHLLNHICKTADKEVFINDLIDLVVSKRLYKFAVRVVTNERDHFSNLIGCSLFIKIASEVWSKYGDYLLEKRYFLEAGLAFTKAIDQTCENLDKVDKAFNCFRLERDWQRSLVLITRQEINTTIRQKYLNQISSELFNDGNVAETLVVKSGYHEHNDDDLSLKLISKGSFYLGAFIASRQNGDKIRQSIAEEVKEELCDNYITWKRELDSASTHYNRLKSLITCKEDRSLRFRQGNCLSSDTSSTIDGSEVSSITSGSEVSKHRARSGAPSLKTKASSKSSRIERDRRMKVGGFHEDLVLIKKLREFISKQKSNQATARNLSATALDFSHDFKSFETYIKQLEDIIEKSFELSQDMMRQLWSRNCDDEVYSLYKHFGPLLEEIAMEAPECLMKPELPSTLRRLEL